MSELPHQKSRTEKPDSYPERFSIPDNKVGWDTDYPEYEPSSFVHPAVIANDCTVKDGGWADPEDRTKVDLTTRKSHCGDINFNKEGAPLNPMGRTGVAGRGLLGKWGPNHAGDPIVLRFNAQTNNLQLLVIKRGDNHQWALPGGMVDDLEKPMTAALRELGEEALEEGFDVDSFIDDRTAVYQGYVDDPRNTDNAWMETTAFASFLEFGKSKSLKLEARDDAEDAKWMDVTAANLGSLYASHAVMVRKAIEIGREKILEICGDQGERIMAVLQ